MKTHTSRKAILFRSLLLLPLLSALIYGFSTKEIVEKEVSTQKIQSEVIQLKATKAEIAEYNKLAIKYNAVDIEKRIIKKNDLERLEIIYKKMTDAQKANAEPFPECIPPPPPNAPKVKKGEKSDIPPPPPPPSPKVMKGEKSDIPPPPPPNAPKVKKGEKSNIPPPPPPSPKVMKGENSDIPPPPPPAPKVSITPSETNGNLYMAAQAPPSPNPDPVEYIKELGKRGATFYIGPHKHSTDEAIELVRKSKEATIDVSKYPDVHLGGC